MFYPNNQAAIDGIHFTVCFVFEISKEKFKLNEHVATRLNQQINTPLVNFINIILAAFSYKIVIFSISVFPVCVFIFFGKSNEAKKLLIKCCKNRVEKISNWMQHLINRYL